MSQTVYVNYATRPNVKTPNVNLDAHSYSKLFSNGDFFEINIALMKSFMVNYFKKFVIYEFEFDTSLISFGLLKADIIRSGGKNRKKVVFKGLFSLKNPSLMIKNITSFCFFVKNYCS